MKLTKPIYGVRDGDIYPTQFQVGEECPPELLDAAQELGAVEVKAKGKAAATNKNQESEAETDADSDGK